MSKTANDLPDLSRRVAIAAGAATLVGSTILAGLPANGQTGATPRSAPTPPS